MAVVLQEGFDHYSAAQAPLKGWSAIPAMTTGRFAAPTGCANSQAARYASTTTIRTKTLPATYTTLFAGFAFRASNTLGGATATFFALRALTVNAMQLQLDALGHIVVKNSGGTTIATGTTVLNANVWYYIELKLIVNGANGSIEVHLDGNTEIAATTPANFGSSAIDNVGLSGQAGNTNDFDDIYLADTTGSAPNNTFLGVCRVTTPMPDGAGAHSQWTANGASPNYACVNEFPPDSDTTYVSSGTPGDLDSYTVADVDGGATVFSVQTNHFAEKDDANTRQIAPLIRQSGTDYIGNTFTMSASYNFYQQIYNQDPTGSAWTPNTFNGDQFGTKDIA